MASTTMRRSAVTALALIAGVLILTDCPASAAEEPPLVSQGRRLFEERGCYDCHTVAGKGVKVGPDLTGVGRRYSASYLTHWLRDNPERGAIHMPKFKLTEPQMRALEAFLLSLREF